VIYITFPVLAVALAPDVIVILGMDLITIKRNGCQRFWRDSGNILFLVHCNDVGVA